MELKIICVGKIKEKYLDDGISFYFNKLKNKFKLTIVELKDEVVPQTMSLAEENIVKQKEGERIIKAINPKDFIICLAINGEKLKTEYIRKLFFLQKENGIETICFIIGGSLGISDEVLKRANRLISFSDMTFTHQLMRLIILEQLNYI